LNAGSAFIEQLTGNYSIDWSLTQHTSLGISLVYENGRQPLPQLLFGFIQVETVENYWRYGIQPHFSWQVSDKLSASLAYNYWRRHSNLDGRNYEENSVSINLAYAF
jgi:uncharacterized protein (PEP-CTERM system associated)